MSTCASNAVLAVRGLGGLCRGAALGPMIPPALVPVNSGGLGRDVGLRAAGRLFECTAVASEGRWHWGSSFSVPPARAIMIQSLMFGALHEQAWPRPNQRGCFRRLHQSTLKALAVEERKRCRDYPAVQQ